MKILEFEHRGQYFTVSLESEALGQVMICDGHGNKSPCPEWKILGVSYHHWRRGIDYPITPDVQSEKLIGGIVWDEDRGSVRAWGGQYFGKLPRITWASVKEE